MGDENKPAVDEMVPKAVMLDRLNAKERANQELNQKLHDLQASNDKMVNYLNNLAASEKAAAAAVAAPAPAAEEFDVSDPDQVKRAFQDLKSKQVELEGKIKEQGGMLLESQKESFQGRLDALLEKQVPANVPAKLRETIREYAKDKFVAYGEEPEKSVAAFKEALDEFQPPAAKPDKSIEEQKIKDSQVRVESGGPSSALPVIKPAAGPTTFKSMRAATQALFDQAGQA